MNARTDGAHLLHTNGSLLHLTFAVTTMCFGGFRSRCCRRQWPHEKLLHSYKRDCNVCVPPAVTEGVTPLFMAVKSGSVQVCELLRLQRVDLKAQADGTPNDTCFVLTQSPLMINIIYILK